MTIADRFAQSFAFVLNNGDVVRPIRLRDRDSGRVAFKVSERGNTNDDAQLVDDEETLANLVLDRGFRVRCSTQNGDRDGLFSPKGRTVIEIRRFDRAQRHRS